VKRKQLRTRLLDSGKPSLRETARAEYGVEVIDIRLRAINHSGSVREAIFDRIRSAREKKVGRLSERRRTPGRRHQRAPVTSA